MPERRSNKIDTPVSLNKRLSAGDLEAYNPQQNSKDKKHEKKDKRSFNTLGRHFIKKMGNLLPRNFSTSTMGDR